MDYWAQALRMQVINRITGGGQNLRTRREVLPVADNTSRIIAGDFNLVMDL